MASTKDNIAIQNLYTCDDPSNAENLIPCDVDTNRWDITALDPQSSPDDSDVCLELVELLVDALRTETQTQEDEDGDDETTATVFEDILSTLVADYLEPCVIWAMEYGDLKQAAVAADGGGGMDDKTDDDAFQNDGGGGGGGVPLTTMSFEPLDLILVWDKPPRSFAVDRMTLLDVTTRHLLVALRAELGQESVDSISVDIATGLPRLDPVDSKKLELPFTMSGSVRLADVKTLLVRETTIDDGQSALQRIVVRAFTNPDALSIYLLRLRRSNDDTLTEVSTVLVPKQLDDTTMMSGTTSTTQVSDDDEFLSTLLIAIIASVAAAIAAVVCFLYCIMCRRRCKDPYYYSDDDDDDEDVDEESVLPGYVQKPPNNRLQSKSKKSSRISLGGHSVASSASSASSRLLRSFNPRTRRSNSNNNNRNRNLPPDYPDLPAIGTAPTLDLEEAGGPIIQDYAESEISASIIGFDIGGGDGGDEDGVSEFDMETLPPPRDEHHHHDDDDDDDMQMSIVDFGHREIEPPPLPSEYNKTNITNRLLQQQYHHQHDDDDDDAVSESGTSLYSYIPDDTSLATYNNDNNTFASRSVMNTTVSSFTKSVDSKDNNNNNNMVTKTPLEQSKQRGLLWSVMDTLKRYETNDNNNDTSMDDNTYLEEDYNTYGKDLIEGTAATNNKALTVAAATTTSTTTSAPSTPSRTIPMSASILGDDHDSDTDSHASNHLLYPTNDDNASLIRDVQRSYHRMGGGVGGDGGGGGETTDDDTIADDASLIRREQKQHFEQLWKDDDEQEAAAAAAAAAAAKQAEVAASTPDKPTTTTVDPKTEKRSNTSSSTPIDLDTLHDLMTTASESESEAAKSRTDKGTADIPTKDDKAQPNSIQEDVADQNPVYVGDVVVADHDQDDAIIDDGVLGADTDGKALVDWVPNGDEDQADVDDYEDGDDDDDDDDDQQRNLPLPTALESSFKDSSSKKDLASVSDSSSISSGKSGSSRHSNNSGNRNVASARKKRSPKWGTTSEQPNSTSNASTTASLSDQESVCSTDSAKFRSLMGIQDTNDAALVFQKRSHDELQQQQSTDPPQASGAAASIAKSNHGNASRNKLESLLRSDGSKDSTETDFDDTTDALLLEAARESAMASLTAAAAAASENKAAAPILTIVTDQKDEKKDDDSEEFDEEDESKGVSPYRLPAAIQTAMSYDSGGDQTATSTVSALSAAPSVDASIGSQMGWF